MNYVVRAFTRVIATVRLRVYTASISNEWLISWSLRILMVTICNASSVKLISAEAASSLTLLMRL